MNSHSPTHSLAHSVFYITTAIDYTNAAPHIGHAYEKILADVIARYHRLKGEDVYFLTGVDQHGQKVQQTAQKLGVEPAEFARETTKKFTALWKKLGIANDGWAETTDPRHAACVQQILQRLFDEGKIYKAKYGGYYSVRQEQFLTDKERDANGEFGADWGEVVFIEEENYYFKLAEHRDWLTQFLAEHPQHVTPAFRQNELRNAIEKMSGDLCISRPKSRLAWGIELPFDRDYVTYVWFDALINYISFAGYLANHETANNPSNEADFSTANVANGEAANSANDDLSKKPLPDFAKLWPANIHVIGKDILVPAHGVYWPVMLRALGFANDEIPPLLVHGYINVAGAKMSKSLGNSVDPDALADKYSAEAIRYCLMRDCATGQDMEFSEERLVSRYNSDLANSLGNLLNRTLSMAWKYREGKLHVTNPSKLLYGDQNPFGLDDVWLAEAVVGLYCERMDGGTVHKQPHLESEPSEPYQIHLALNHVFQNLVNDCNGLVEETAPWKLAKDEAQADKLDAVLYTLAESLRIIAILISPVMPNAARGMLEQLAVSEPQTLADATWGKLANGHQLGKPTPLFPRIEMTVSEKV